MRDEKCNLCGWNCGIDRNEKFGVCKCGTLPKVALASVHEWEEPCISGTRGSGTIFFSGCNFKCEFCQNYKISQEYLGKEISVNRLAEIFLEEQAKNVHNVNLVSPTPYVYQIIEAIDIARKNGFSIPIVYNTNSYENIETINLLDGYVDVYLPDLKYFSDEVAIKYSKIPNYFSIATKAIQKMLEQVGNPIFDDYGIIKKGVIIRHLVLPNHLTETKKIVEWVLKNFGEEVYLSIMAQYFPTYNSKNYTEINRKLNRKEYYLLEKIVQNVKNGYIQELGEHEEEYVPNFEE